jgi:hypothetical protein
VGSACVLLPCEYRATESTPLIDFVGGQFIPVAGGTSIDWASGPIVPPWEAEYIWWRPRIRDWSIWWRGVFESGGRRSAVVANREFALTMPEKSGSLELLEWWPAPPLARAGFGLK